MVHFNDEVDWLSVFGEFVSRKSLADPNNPRRHVFISTILLVEAGMMEVDAQVAGRSSVAKATGLSWARITRDIVLERACLLHGTLLEQVSRDDASQELMDKFPKNVLREAKVGETQFVDRWKGKGGMANFVMCVVRMAGVDPRWRRVLDRGPKQAMALLPGVSRGETSLAKVISDVAS